MVKPLTAEEKRLLARVSVFARPAYYCKLVLRLLAHDEAVTEALCDACDNECRRCALPPSPACCGGATPCSVWRRRQLAEGR